MFRQNDMLRAITDEHDRFSLKMQKRGQEINKEQELKQERQNKVAIQLARYSSPSAGLTFIINRLARSGVYSSDKVFKETIEEYKLNFDNYAREQIESNPMLLSGGLFGGIQRDDSAVYPDRTVFRREPLNVSLDATLVDYTIMTLYGLFFFVVAFFSFLRYDLR